MLSSELKLRKIILVAAEVGEESKWRKYGAWAKAVVKIWTEICNYVFYNSIDRLYIFKCQILFA